MTEIATEYDVMPQLLHRRRREVVDRLPDLFADPAAAQQAAAQDAKVDDLYAQIGQLTTRVARLNKSGPDPES